MVKKRLLDEVRDLIRVKHYSIRTEEAYIYWIRNFILFHNKKHPSDMGASEIKKYLTWLAVSKKVAASTQNQALNALVFLYKHSIKKDFGDLLNVVRAKKPKRIPTVLSHSEVKKIISASQGVYQIIMGLFYGSGMRCMECLRLRIKDLDFERNQISIFDGKGQKARVTMLPHTIKEDLKKHLHFVFSLHKKDIADGYGSVYMPFELDKKYRGAEKQWKWQYVFPAKSISKDPRSGIYQRHHISEDAVNRTIAQCAICAQINKKVTSHTFRHSFATHLVEDGVPLHEIQELLGHKNIETTRIYLHVAKNSMQNRLSPLDKLSNSAKSSILL